MDTIVAGNIDNTDNQYESEWFSTIKCIESMVRVKLDSGSGTNCIQMETFKKIKPKSANTIKNSSQIIWW